MKIGILTWLYNGNYGSLLQAVALQNFLKNQGFDVVDINYKASIKTKLLNWVSNRNSPKLFVGKFNDFKQKITNKHSDEFSKRSKLFNDFKKEHLLLTNICRNETELIDNCNEIDCFICGSDQIWSPALLNPIFYLSFVKSDKLKISYAPSFGVMKLNEFKKNRICNLLKEIDFISIREKQGQDLIKELVNKEVPILIDPTMLLTANEWKEYIIEEPLIKDDYIFCYLLNENKTYIDEIKKYSKSNNLEVVIVPTNKGPFNTGFKEYIDVGPSEWLNLLLNSKYVITDSFHGSVFSLIFHKEFALFKRFSDNDKFSENSRIYNLARIFSIEDRIFTIGRELNFKELKKIDFDHIDKIIDREKNISKEWLLNILNSKKGK